MRLFLLLKKRPPPAKGMEGLWGACPKKLALAPKERAFHSSKHKHELTTIDYQLNSIENRIKKSRS
ncbi:hypothetical protein PSDVSF_16140 [Pseudodesulfovibrio sediminis]|uniref:Uncharacterized protein n=1 Tax=Pseudodesulfovibrio sediminis TaxID=2810563 RepID=A0ABN6ESC3_9BACT|nr:hypothetical protein PSDVSF_16140 [Pseudodesulfovibrio sediminis]